MKRKKSEKKKKNPEELTPTELVILEMHAKDLKVPEIKARLGRSGHTPKNHVCNLKKKLRVRTMTGAVVRAYQLRKLDLDTVEIELRPLKNE